MSTKQYIYLIFVFTFSVLLAFYGGIYLKNFIIDDNKAQLKGYLPYFSDEIIMISKEQPNRIIIASATRFTTDHRSFIHRQRIFFYNGKKWIEEFNQGKSDNLDILPTSNVSYWDVKDDESRVLKQSVKGGFQLKDININFDVPEIQNEIGVRSLSYYTQFRSASEGSMEINGETFESYVLYTRTYSYNANIGLVSTSNPIGINTNWLAFWDEDGNFYNIDETIVNDPDKGDYKSHSIAILKDKDGNIKKTFNLDIKTKDRNSYLIKTSDVFSAEIVTNFVSKHRKNSGNSKVDNEVGLVNGFATQQNKKINGVGIYEYIYQ